MKKSKIISSLNKIANILDDNLFHKEADNITKIMIKLSAREDEFQGPAPEQPDDAYDINKIINPPTEFAKDIPEPENPQTEYDDIMGINEPIIIPFPNSGYMYGSAGLRGQFVSEINIQFTDNVSSTYSYTTNEIVINEIVGHTEKNIKQYWYTLRGLEVYYDLPKTIQNVNIKITEPENNDKLLFENNYSGDVDNNGKVKLTPKSAPNISNLYEVSNLQYTVQEKFDIDKFIRLLQTDVPNAFIAQNELDPEDVRWNKAVFAYHSYFEPMIDEINEELEDSRESEYDRIIELDEEEMKNIVSSYADYNCSIYHDTDISDERFAVISIKGWPQFLNKELSKF